MLGLDCMTGLQTARILAERGVPVVGVAEDRHHFACRSRAVDRVIVGSPETLVDVLRGVAPPGGEFVAIPCSDAWVRALAAGRPAWPAGVRSVMSEDGVVETLMDKARFARFAAAHGIPVPRTVVVDDRGSLDAAVAGLSFPAVVKPARKPPEWDAVMGGKVRVVAGVDELRSVAARGLEVADALVVQEWVPGGEDSLISFNGYFDRHGQPRAAFVARKLRQWPPHAGTSASGEEIRDDEVAELATELFQKAGFRGLAYLEVKRAPDGSLFVIEPNVGRPTGRSAICEAGGVELVYSAYRDALGVEPLADNRQTYRGVKWVYLRHDLQAAIVAIRSGELTVGRWLASLRGPRVYAVWSIRDPLPFLVDNYHAISKLFRGRARLRMRLGRANAQPRSEE